MKQMEAMPNTELPHTAIPSWSGFIYQGKVALLHVLKLLCEIENGHFSIQLDSLEAFAILKNGSEIYSLHQVKAHAPSLLSGYNDCHGKSAFEKLKERAN